MHNRSIRRFSKSTTSLAADTTRESRPNVKIPKSKHRGVSYQKSNKKWSAHICLGRTLKHLGSFKTQSDAVQAYQVEASKLRSTSSSQCTVTSKFRGIFFNKRSKNWRSAIRVNEEYINVGSFPTENKAARARVEKLCELGLEGWISGQCLGVSFDKITRKWNANICVQGNLIHIGVYSSQVEATKAFVAKVHTLGLELCDYLLLPGAETDQNTAKLDALVEAAFACDPGEFK